MTRLAWMALLLIPLLLVILGLARALRTGSGFQAPRVRFLVVSLLFHAGLLFVLDLVLVAIPVVASHRELIRSVVLKTFSITPTGRGGSALPWEALPEGPPPAAPVVTPLPTPRLGSEFDVPFDPDLKGIAPTLNDAQALALPPGRVVFLPRIEREPERGVEPSNLPRVAASLPEMPEPEAPKLLAVARVPDPDFQAPAASPGRREADLGPPAADPFLPAPRPFAMRAMPDPISHEIRREPTTDPVQIPVIAQRERFHEDLPEIPRLARLEPKTSEPMVKAPANASLPKATLKDVEIAINPAPALRELPRLEPSVPRLEPLPLPTPKLDVAPPPLPVVRLPTPETEAVVMPSADLNALRLTFALRPAEVRKDLVKTMGGTEASEAAVERGLAWLVAHQGSDGNWSLEDLHCQGHKCDGQGSAKTDAAANGLALMALLGAGHSTEKGAHVASVRRGINWLVAHQKADGCLSEPGGTQMYSHGLASIALCEAFGLTADPALRGPCEKAVKFIVEAQDPQTGGWRYSPRGGGDTSVFGWQVMALKSAEMAGLPVPAETYRLAAHWLDSVAAGPRKLLYGYQPGREARPSLTAEALLCRQYLGMPRSSESMTVGGQYLLANLPKVDARNLYYWYYATQVMYHLGGPDWSTWNPKLRDLLVATQSNDGPASGSWHPQRPSTDKWGDSGGRVYETAISLLILEVYYRHLPLYQQLTGDRARD